MVIDSGPVAKAIGRAMVCAYFLNMAVDDCEGWWHLKGVPVPPQRWPDEPVAARPPTFPWLQLLLLLPCALLAAAGVAVPVTASALLARLAWDDALLTMRQTLNMLRHGSRLTELVMKRVAVLGSVLLVLAHSIRDNPPRALRGSRYAGLLLSGDDDVEEEGQQATPEQQRRRAAASASRSMVLLLGRLLIACLFTFAGMAQLRRIKARREYAQWSSSPPPPSGHQAADATHQKQQQRHHGIPDSHDNAFVLLVRVYPAATATAGSARKQRTRLLSVGPRSLKEMPAAAADVCRIDDDSDWCLCLFAGPVCSQELLLALPFVLGIKTEAVSRLLAGVLMAESLVAWPFWQWYWPSWHYAQHVRDHFFTNTAIAGGLLLLQSLGAGALTLDAALERRKQR